LQQAEMTIPEIGVKGDKDAFTPVFTNLQRRMAAYDFHLKKVRKKISCLAMGQKLRSSSRSKIYWSKQRVFGIYEVCWKWEENN